MSVDKFGKPEKTKIRISLSGDLMLGRSFNEKVAKLLKQGYTPEEIREQIWSLEFLKIVEGTVWLANLETSITSTTDRWPNKAFNFRMLPVVAYTLLPPQLAAVNLANNHILDYKTAGLEETLDILDLLHIGHTGAGLNLLEAKEPWIKSYYLTYLTADLTDDLTDHLATDLTDEKTTDRSISIGLLGAGDHPTEWEVKASKFATHPGIFFVDLDNKAQWKELLEAVTKTAARVDILVVYLHVGSNWQSSVDPRVILLAHTLIEHGSKIVAITSPHHLQPVEFYRGGIIFYSLGDQLDDYAVDPVYRNDLAMLVQVEFVKNEFDEVESIEISQVLLYPTKIKELSLTIGSPVHLDVS